MLELDTAHGIQTSPNLGLIAHLFVALALHRLVVRATAIIDAVAVRHCARTNSGAHRHILRKCRGRHDNGAPKNRSGNQAFGHFGPFPCPATARIFAA